MKKPTVWISLRVPKELRDKLDRLSREDKRNMVYTFLKAFGSPMYG